MSARIEWSGLNELIHELTVAPRVIRDEGMTIVKEEAAGAAVEISQRYPRRTGRLASRVRVEYPSTTILAAIVTSSAPHSHLYEFGTDRRFTNQGWNRGTMPEANPQVTVPIAQRRRARMFRRLIEMLRRRGFEVRDA